MKIKQKTYVEENFIDVIYSLVNAYERSRQVPDKDKIKNLTPINGVYSGYFLNKVEFTDPRTGETFKDEWKRTDIDDEEDRLKVIRKMNKRIQEYNKFAKAHEEELGIDKIEQQKYYQQFEYPEWSLSIYLSSPTLKKNNELIPTRTINNQWFYKKATIIPRKEYTLRLNKTIYDWILHMLPQSFNDSSTKFLSDKHILFEPKLEFENWFMKNGMLINDSPSLFDELEEEEGFSELEIYKNTDIAKTKKIKELRHQIKMVKEPYRARIQKMNEEGSIQTWIDDNCRKKNKKINWEEMGRQLGCDPQTAQRVLKETGLTYLFDDSKNTYLK